jgi:nitroimidazol reductase NimA-like FMN-containing flavoprotein (pyridoxamine 5'-phosphate oxidase superfamily)
MERNTDAWLEVLSLDECLDLLARNNFGRLAVVLDGFPIVVPVNYKFVDPGGRRWVALRTRPGNVIEQASRNVGFQIDHADRVYRRGWAVLVRGTLQRVDPDAAEFRERFDPEPWIDTDRDAWLVVEPFKITGRRLHAERRPWAFRADAYL